MGLLLSDGRIKSGWCIFRSSLLGPWLALALLLSASAQANHFSAQHRSPGLVRLRGVPDDAAETPSCVWTRASIVHPAAHGHSSKFPTGARIAASAIKSSRRCAIPAVLRARAKPTGGAPHPSDRNGFSWASAASRFPGLVGGRGDAYHQLPHNKPTYNRCCGR